MVFWFWKALVVTASMAVPNLALAEADVVLREKLHKGFSYLRCVQLAYVLDKKGAKITSPIPGGWTSSQFTDPRRHNPKRFVYIVHALGSDLEYLKSDTNLGAFAPDIWASVISNDVLYTYGKASGLILSIEPDNVVGTSCYDTGFTYEDYKIGFEQYQSLHSGLTPEQMLASSQWPRYMSVEAVREVAPVQGQEMYQNNELLLRGRGGAGSIVRIVGIFLNRADKYIPTKKALRRFAKKHKLPVVEIDPAITQ